MPEEIKKEEIKIGSKHRFSKKILKLESGTYYYSVGIWLPPEVTKRIKQGQYAKLYFLSECSKGMEQTIDFLTCNNKYYLNGEEIICPKK